MPAIIEDIQERDKYTLRLTYLADGRIGSITIWTKGMDGKELGELVAELKSEYSPLKFVIIDD